MSFPLTDIQMACLPIVRGLVVDKPWLLPSWVYGVAMAESGWDPAAIASDFATTGSLGLLQVTRATAAQMGFAGQDQTNPGISLATGVAYLAWLRSALMRYWGFTSTLAMHPLIESYNVGEGGYLAGRRNDRYWLKVASFRQEFAFIDEA